MRIKALSLVMFLGLTAASVSGYYVFQDWAALNMYYAKWEKLVMSNADMRSLFIAEANQNAFRINCFADGVGVLLGTTLAAIGVHGLCSIRQSDPATISRS